MMYVCYGYVDDVMVKQVAGIGLITISPSAVSTMFHESQSFLKSVEIQKIIYSTSDHKRA